MSNLEILGTTNGVLNGSGGDDTFNLTGANTGNAGGISFSDVTTVDAAGGNDQVVTNADVALTSVANQIATNGVTLSNIESFSAGSGILDGTAGADVFSYTGDQAGTANGIAFVGVDTINAGDQNDILNLGATQAGGLDFFGQGGIDTINITGDLTLTTDMLDAEFFNVGSNTVELTGNNLIDSIAVDNTNGTLNVNGPETVLTYSSTGGTLGGAGILTATNGASLNDGSSVGGNLLGNITSNGTVGVTGTIGGGSLTVQTGTLALAGTSTNSPVFIIGGATLDNQNGGLSGGALVVNQGTLDVDVADTVAVYTSNGGLLSGAGTLTATTANLNNNSSVTGKLSGTTTSNGTVQVTGSIGGGALTVQTGTLTLGGVSTNDTVAIQPASTLVDNGDLGDTATVTNQGTLTVNTTDTIGVLNNDGGLVNGTGTLTATTYDLSGGSEIAAPTTLGMGILNSDGAVTLRGTSNADTININTGTLSVIAGGQLGQAASIINLAGGASLQNGGGLTYSVLQGTGTVVGGLNNSGIVSPGGDGVLGTLTIDGDFTNSPAGTLRIDVSNPGGALGADLLNVNGVATYAGNLDLNLVGPDAPDGGSSIQIVNAVSGSGALAPDLDFATNVLSYSFDPSTGVIQFDLADEGAKFSKAYQNLNENQTEVFFALVEDTRDPGFQNVVTTIDPATGEIRHQLLPGQLDPTLEGGLMRDATNDAIQPGGIVTSVVNQLSPEVHRGLADYSEENLRNHVRNGERAQSIHRGDHIDVFAQLWGSTAGAQSLANNASYTVETFGLTGGVRYEVAPQWEVGMLLGVDTGTVSGALIDADSQGFMLGAFGGYLIDPESSLRATAHVAYGMYEHDVTRQSFGGAVQANGIGSDVFQIGGGISGVAYSSGPLRVIPGARLTYANGEVDAFSERGAGIPLSVQAQDIEALLLDLELLVEYDITEKLSVYGSLGYTMDLLDDEDAVGASFVAGGAAARPMRVTAPGIGDEAFLFGVGGSFEVAPNAKVGIHYLGEFFSDADAAHNFGIGGVVSF
ncbi:autotransporter domain-containing protein [Haloferula sp. A504]|uniref:autotransporter outer membrane beta-barrel domain-containing protein n=1 Tax=Haloferula sp. A504 TaxID=3373601 RepID=UPI0031C55CBF|nr:autotransporter domain-containing protein [Verrucomicrobiaceae bacterium E54]